MPLHEKVLSFLYAFFMCVLDHLNWRMICTPSYEVNVDYDFESLRCTNRFSFVYELVVNTVYECKRICETSL